MSSSVSEGKEQRRRKGGDTAAPLGGLGDELSLEDAPTRELPTDFNAIEETLSEGAIKLGDGKTRSIVIKPFDGRMRIQQTDVAPDLRGRGLNQQNVKDALSEAQRQGMPLDSDVSFTPPAWGAWQKAFRDGVFEGDYDAAAIKAAFERDPSSARNLSGEPWIKNIRLGPAG